MFDSADNHTLLLEYAMRGQTRSHISTKHLASTSNQTTAQSGIQAFSPATNPVLIPMLHDILPQEANSKLNIQQTLERQLVKVL